ncbi:MAG: glycoside hydrolase family 16 protein [Alphaproteobacteria bacterium]
MYKSKLLAPVGVASVIVLLIFSSAQSGDASSASATSASFVERFDKFDAGRWIKSDGWSNGPQQKCTWKADNVRAESGTLELTLRASPSDKKGFTCAEIQSKGTYGYGTYEVRMRAPAAPGLVTAFFTYIGKAQGKPHDEIDFEFLGKDTGAVQLNYYVSGKGGHEHMAKLGLDAETTPALYSFEWKPNAIFWYINGELVYERHAKPGHPIPTNPGKIFLSIWNGNDMDEWLGSFEYPGKPLVALYDLVAFTKAGDACQFPESVVCKREKIRKAQLDDD